MKIISNLKYLFVGLYFGIIFVKAEVVSWFRIQEMFRFQSFHMYGVIGTAVLVGAISVFLIKKFNIKTISGQRIEYKPKPFTLGNIFGGLIFGCGWALTGACPGPLYALMGGGYWIMAISFIMAIVGTWCYGFFKEKLPH
jgi:uncharacterized protein